jgi:hypothetical protein
MIDIKKACCIISALLIIVYLNTIISTYPIIKYLFTDKINFILLTILVVFVMLIDLYYGVVLGLLILYISLNISNKPVPNPNSKPNTRSNTLSNTLSNPIPSTKFNTIPNPNTNDKPYPYIADMAKSNKISAGVQNDIFNNVISDNNVDDMNDVINKYNPNPNKLNSIINNSNNSNIKTDDIYSESEFIYDTTKPFPNNNIKPFLPNLTENFVSLPYENDFMTNIGESERSGFDVTGCRYDMKNSPQNLTQYGPPVSQCSVYNSNQLQTCGTLFYPLNA